MSYPSNVPFVSSWTLVEALQLHNDLLPVAKAVGFGMGLTGGVLRNCRSEHDVDVIFYPLQAPHGDVGTLKAALENLGMRQHTDRETLVEGWRSRGSADEKHVEVWELDGKRIDLFFLR